MLEPFSNGGRSGVWTMNDVTHISDRSPACDCFPRCLDIASGVLMHRHGLTADEARAALRRSAQRHRSSAHAVFQGVINSASQGPHGQLPG